MSKTAGELYARREKRVHDAVALRKPDRVPILVNMGFYPARYSGMTIREVLYDPEKLWTANWKAMTDLEPDMVQNPFAMQLVGPVLEALDCKQLLWPGHGLSSDHSYQFVENEYMKEDEYDRFLADPTDFVFRKLWPRMCGALKGLGRLPSLGDFYSYAAFPIGLASFSLPEVVGALEALKKAGKESVQVASYSRSFSEEARKAGYPITAGSSALAPFDVIGDFLRGTKRLMLDLYRRPDKVIKACEELLPSMIGRAVASSKASQNPRVFIAIHKGIDGFMSVEQFKKFYWPTLRELMIALINHGLTPFPLWEGDCASRLEIIKDIPPGKACYAFEATDLFRAKEILRDTVCIQGNVPLSLLIAGTPDKVKAYCKKLIERVGIDGGYIMSASTALDDAKPENVEAMFQFTKEYGVY